MHAAEGVGEGGHVRNGKRDAMWTMYGFSVSFFGVDKYI